MKAGDVFQGALGQLSKSKNGSNRQGFIPIVRDGALNATLVAAFRSRLEPGDFNFVEQCGDTVSTGMRSALEGSLEAAETIFATTFRELRALQIGEEAKLIASSLLVGPGSYVDYRLQKWQTAKDKIQLGLICDDLLLQRSEYSIFHLHRLTLIENSIRVERREGHAETAARMTGELLLYLSGCSHSMSFPGHWNCDYSNLPLSNIQHKFACASGELAQSLACLDAQTGSGLFALADGFVDQNYRDECVDKYAADWFRAKKSFFCDTERFLDDSNSLLTVEPASIRSGKLWCAILLDVLTLCGKTAVCDEVEWRQVLELFRSYRFATPLIKAYLEVKSSSVLRPVQN